MECNESGRQKLEFLVAHQPGEATPGLTDGTFDRSEFPAERTFINAFATLRRGRQGGRLQNEAKIR